MTILIDASQSPYFLDLSNAFTQLLPLQDVNILCLSNTGPITIALPRSETLQGGNVRILVQDVFEASVNNITIMASGDDSINDSSSITINTNKGFFEIRQGVTPPPGLGFPGSWSAVTSPQSSSVSGVPSPVIFSTVDGQDEYTNPSLELYPIAFVIYNQQIITSPEYSITGDTIALVPVFPIEDGVNNLQVWFANF